ncbi:MAG: hypothetical protein IJB46_02845 [Prevotella sp.]|nr:hypothetical protein [Prevotella sp.]
MKTSTKELIQYSTASMMVLSGIILTFVCFFMKGDVTNGVLWYMAQALSFTGGVFGISIYFRTKLGESENRIREYINEKIKEQ